MKRLFLNAHCILPPSSDRSCDALLVDGGVIQELGHAEELGEIVCGAEVIDCAEDYLAPGFIDIHCHGAVGRDAMEATSEAFAAILRFHASRGTIWTILSTVAAGLEDMERVLRAAADYLGSGAEGFGGIHLEGPWFSPKRCGAHAGEKLRNPCDAEIDALLEYRSVIRRVTLAPELPGAVSAIRRLVVAGIAVSAGHSDATEQEAAAGFAACITQTTHLHNAMSSLRKTNPPRPGLAEAALAAPGILCELIADGIHVPDDLLAGAVAAKGWEGIALVSDATAGAGLCEGGIFRLGTLECRVGNGAAWTGGENDRRLAGSTQPLFAGIRTMVERAGVSLSEAVAMATLVPARSLSLARSLGSLEKGKRANLVRFTKDWDIRGVWSEGHLVPDGSSPLR